MKMSFDCVNGQNEWIHSEIFSSLNIDQINEIHEKDPSGYDVKLIINGIEVEPSIFNLIMNNVEKFIKKEAHEMINEKLSEASSQVNILHNLVAEAGDKIREQFDIDPDEDFS